MTNADLVAEVRWGLATSAGRCPMTCPHGDRCSRTRGHTDAPHGGCNHRVCPCNEPNVDRDARLAELADRLERAGADMRKGLERLDQERARAEVAERDLEIAMRSQNFAMVEAAEARAEAAEALIDECQEAIRTALGMLAVRELVPFERQMYQSCIDTLAKVWPRARRTGGS